jgi:hypothetical protein
LTWRASGRICSFYRFFLRPCKPKFL